MNFSIETPLFLKNLKCWISIPAIISSLDLLDLLGSMRATYLAYKRSSQDWNCASILYHQLFTLITSYNWIHPQSANSDFYFEFAISILLFAIKNDWFIYLFSLNRSKWHQDESGTVFISQILNLPVNRSLTEYFCWFETAHKSWTDHTESEFMTEAANTMSFIKYRFEKPYSRRLPLPLVRNENKNI